MKKLFILLFAITLIVLTSCGKSNNLPTQTITDEPSTTITTSSDDNSTTEEEDETANMKLTLKIGDTLVDVSWLDNESVKDLKKHVKDGLTINYINMVILNKQDY